MTENPEFPVEPVTASPIRSALNLLRIWPSVFWQVKMDPVAAIQRVSPNGRYAPGIFYIVLLELISQGLFLLVKEEPVSKENTEALMVLIGYAFSIGIMILTFCIPLVVVNFILRQLGSEPTLCETFTFVAIAWPLVFFARSSGVVHEALCYAFMVIWLFWFYRYTKIRGQLSVAKALVLPTLFVALYFGAFVASKYLDA